jgi:hypothetical protein
MNLNKESVEKLLNILGRRLVNDYYGIDVTFKVEELSLSDRYGYNLMLSTEPTLPEVLRVVKSNSWDSGRYATIMDLSFVLESQLRYLAPKDEASIIFINRPINTNSEELNDIANRPNDWYLKHPERFIELEGNGTFVETTMGMSFIKLVDGSLEYADAKITDDFNEDWWTALTPKDKEKLTKAFG